MSSNPRRLALGLVAIMLAACSELPGGFGMLAPAGGPPGGGEGANAREQSGTGTLRLTVRWPAAAGYRAQVIPDSAATLHVIVKKGTDTVSETDVTRTAGATTVATIPLRADTGLSATVEAYPSGTYSTTKVAEATSAGTFEIKSSAVTSLALTLGAVSTPALSGVSDTYPGVGESITISGSAFTPAWRTSGPTVMFTTSGASASAAPSSVAADSLTVTVPSSAATGGITVVTDGVESGTFPLPVFSGVGTFVGSSAGYQDGTGTATQFYRPIGIAFMPSGNLVVAEDPYDAPGIGHTIRSVTPGGVVTTIAGSSGNAGYVDDSGTDARFRRPFDVVVDSAGTIYVADYDNNTIRKIVGTTVTTLAGNGTAGDDNGVGTAARFRGPSALELDTAQENLYVAEYFGNRIRKIELSSQTVSTYAGTGSQGSSNNPNPLLATFNGLHGLAFDGDGTLYVSEFDDRTIRRIAPDGGAVSTLVGPGVFGGPAHMAYYSGALYVADYMEHRLRKVSTVDGSTTVVFGNGNAYDVDGSLSAARTWNPAGVAVQVSPFRLYITDYSHRVRRVRP